MSTQEAADYFRRLHARVATQRPPLNGVVAAARSAERTPPLPPTGGAPHSASPSTGNSILTQVSHTGTPPSAGASPSTRLRSISGARRRNTQVATNEDDVRLRRLRLQQIQSQAKNLSPMDPTKYAPLLPSVLPALATRKCLVLDVDETLVHSSFNATHQHDLHLECRVNGSICHVYVGFRPHLMAFLDAVKGMFEVVIFTASVSQYCHPLMNRLDPDASLGSNRLCREHCSMVNGSYVKDLSLLGRPLDQIAIIDNSPVAYLFQPRNAIPILSWFDDPNDTELLKLLPMLEQLAVAPNVYDTLDMYNAALLERPT